MVDRVRPALERLASAAEAIDQGFVHTNLVETDPAVPAKAEPLLRVERKPALWGPVRPTRDDLAV